MKHPNSVPFNLINTKLLTARTMWGGDYHA